MTATQPRANSFTLDHRPAPLDGKHRNAGVQYRTICTCNGEKAISPWRESANLARIDGAEHHRKSHRGEPR